MRKYMQLLLILLTTFFLMAGCSQKQSTSTVLEGHVSYGPIFPVESLEQPTPTPNPLFYAGLEVIVYKENGKTVISRVPVDSAGDFQVVLPVGTYMIDMKLKGMMYSKDLPMVVEINNTGTKKVEIFIDTGIR